MSKTSLAVYSVLMLVIVSFGFLVGFMQFGGPDLAARAGLAFGLSSAIAWGTGSFGGPTGWNNFFNFIAAVCAAISLGLLAPADQACRSSAGALHYVCGLKAAPAF